MIVGTGLGNVPRAHGGRSSQNGVAIRISDVFAGLWSRVSVVIRVAWVTLLLSILIRRTTCCGMRTSRLLFVTLLEKRYDRKRLVEMNEIDGETPVLQIRDHHQSTVGGTLQ